MGEEFVRKTLKELHGAKKGRGGRKNRSDVSRSGSSSSSGGRRGGMKKWGSWKKKSQGQWKKKWGQKCEKMSEEWKQLPETKQAAIEGMFNKFKDMSSEDRKEALKGVMKKFHGASD